MSDKNDLHKVPNEWDYLLNSLVIGKRSDLPRISVIIPTYNSSHLIRKTLVSIANQDYDNLEVIIIDAESEDRTFEVVQEFAHIISHIYFINSYNLPLMYNKGVSLARGEYVSFMWPGHTYVSRYAFKHIAGLAAEYNLPDLIYASSYASYSSAANPFVVFFPFTFSELKKGNSPTFLFSYWFKVKSVKFISGLNEKYTFFKGWLDFLCRFRKEPQMHIISTKWVLTEFDYGELKTMFLFKDFWDTTTIITKHFGPIFGLSWIWTKKDIPLFKWMLHKIKRHLLGN